MKTKFEAVVTSLKKNIDDARKFLQDLRELGYLDNDNNIIKVPPSMKKLNDELAELQDENKN